MGRHMNPTIKKILEHCEFGHGKCYMLSILPRKKNNGDLTHGTEIMRRKLIMSENDVEDAYKYLKSRAQLDPDHTYYMYVNVNPRNMKKALYIMIKKLLSMLNDYESDECMPNRLAKIGGLWYSCLENDKCRGKTRNFLVDVDVEDTDILEAVLASIPEDTYIRMYPTRNGYHIVTRPFDSRAFEKEWNKETASINKDGLLFLEAINFEV